MRSIGANDWHGRQINDMERWLLKRSINSSRSYLVLFVVIWITTAIITSSFRDLPFHSLLLQIGLGSITGYLFLKIIGFFSPWRLIPRKSDPFVVLVTLPITGILSAGIVDSLTGSSLTTTRELFTLSPFIGALLLGA